MRRKGVRSKKLIERRRKKFLLKLVVITIVTVILIGFVSWLSYRSSIQIINIVVNGNNVVSDSDIENVTRGVLDGKYFFLFPRADSLIYPEKEIETVILTIFKQIKSVDIVRTDFQTLSMDIEEQKPYALWCISKNEEMQDDCYFLNKDGLIFSKAPNFTGNVFFRFYGYLNGIDLLGKYYLKVNDEFNRINILIDSIRGLDIVPTELRPSGDIDMELYMNDGSKILFTRVQRSSEILDNLKVVLESETFKNMKMDNVEYIDLRFGNKVYFKLR